VKAGTIACTKDTTGVINNVRPLVVCGSESMFGCGSLYKLSLLCLLCNWEHE
jgi:hypothetical protein